MRTLTAYSTFCLTITFPAVALLLIAADAPPQGVDAERNLRRSIDSLEVMTPCAERVIVRNHGDSARSVEIIVGDELRTATIRGRATNARLPFFSLLRSLPSGGAAGIVRHAGADLHFDSRGKTPCVVSIATKVPEVPPSDYMFANTERAQTDVGHFPGLVSVRFRQEASESSIDSLLKRLGGTILASSPQGSRIDPRFIVWFDDDDESAVLAARRALVLQRSELIAFVRPLPFGGTWRAPED
jgi:hypothetical protein